MAGETTRAGVVTRADVARLAGVSAAVVSYVVNGGPRPVAAQTRERVLAAIQSLNYRPNATARALSRGIADVLGMLVADSRNPFFAQLIYETHRHSAARGHSMLIASTEGSPLTIDEQITELASRQLHGLISVHPFSRAQLDVLGSLGIRVVLVNQHEPADGVRSVRVDYRVGASLAVEHLIGHGYRDIGFVGASEHRRARERGWADALEKAGMSTGPRFLTEYSLQGGYAAGRQLVGLTHRPDAVFVSSDQMAMGLLRAVHEAGLRVPEDIALVSFDGVAEAAYLWPPLTTVHQPVSEIAKAAIGAVLDGDEGADVLLPTELVVRRSCGCGG